MRDWKAFRQRSRGGTFSYCALPKLRRRCLSLKKTFLFTSSGGQSTSRRSLLLRIWALYQYYLSPSAARQPSEKLTLLILSCVHPGTTLGLLAPTRLKRHLGRMRWVLVSCGFIYRRCGTRSYASSLRPIHN